MPYVGVAEYSPIRHLATVLWPPWLNRESAIFVMLTFALDAGGDENTDFLTVAGFASSMTDWDDFSAKWKARLDADGIAFFRAVDANNFRGPFEHWHERPDREQLRRSLFSDLMNLIHSHAYWKIACTVVNKDFHDSNTEMRRQFAKTAYSLAARTCEKYGRHWVKNDWRRCSDLELAFIFELGDPGQDQGELREQLRKDYGHIPPNFRPKKDTQREDGVMVPGFIPLQAADWLAWEMNRAARDFYPEKLASVSQMRWPMQEFWRSPIGRLGVYTPENLKAMDKMLELENTLDSWETQLGVGRHANAKGKTAQ